MYINIFVFLGLLLLLFVLAVLWFAGRDYKRGHSTPKQGWWPQSNNVKKGLAGEKAVSRILSWLPQFPPDTILRVSVDNGTKVLCWDDLLELFMEIKVERMSYKKAKAFGFELDRIQIKETGNNQKHIEGVQAYKQRKAMAIRDGICPRCGSKLVKRKGKYGDFFGCSNYPICKFIL